jgi:alkylhydroperoxidase family enzyme
VAEEQISALQDYRSSGLFSETEKLVLAYADCMTQTPVEVSQELFDKLRERLSPAQLVELTTAVAWENYRARFNHAFGAESENFSARSVCALPVRTDAAAD